MAEKETIILDFKVDQGDAINELEKTKKSILQLTKDQADLNKAYKEGNVTLDEYVSEQVRLEAILKKQKDTYSNVQKSITGVKSSMDKLIDATKQASNQVSIAGVNVGGLAQRITSLANPVTAAIGLVGALGAAYARSTIGAKDLEFASNQLSAATTILTNNFAALISSSEDGEGFFSKAADNFLFVIDVFTLGANELSKKSKEIAKAQEEIDDLMQDEISARSRVSDILAENQDLITRIGDSQTSFNDKINLSEKAIENISRAEDLLLDIKKKQLLQAQIILNGDKLNEDKKRTVLEIEREISNIQKDTARKTAGLERQQDNLVDTEQKRLETIRKQNEALERQLEIQEFNEFERKVGRLPAQEQRSLFQQRQDATREGVTGQIAGDIPAADRQKIQLTKKTEDQIREELIFTANLRRELQEMDIETTGVYFQTIATLASAFAGEQSGLFKATASGETIIATYQAATKALASTTPPLSFALAALTVAQGLANLARINDVSFAAGGGDFYTKGPALLMVGDNPGGVERVTVEPISGKGKTTVNGNMYAMAGGGSLTTGQLTANESTSKFNQAIMTSNILKQMPKQVVSWREWAEVNERMTVKEDVSSF